MTWAAWSESMPAPRPWAVAGGLGRHRVRCRQIELPVEDRIARRVLVDAGHAVPDPLARHEDRQLHVQLDRAHLERRGVPVAHQIADQPAILADPPGAAAVGDARGLNHGGVVAHVVDDADEAMVEDRDGPVEQVLHGRNSGPARFRHPCPAVGDIRLVGVTQTGRRFGRHSGVRVSGKGHNLGCPTLMVRPGRVSRPGECDVLPTDESPRTVSQGDAATPPCRAGAAQRRRHTCAVTLPRSAAPADRPSTQPANGIYFSCRATDYGNKRRSE